MNKQRISLLLFAVITVTAWAQKNAIHSGWRSAGITVDGSLSDWPQPLPYSDSKAKVQYAVANDASYLYLCLRATDAQTRTKIIRGGMDIWLDVKGGKKQQCAIHFPLKNNAVMDMPPLPDEMDAQNTKNGDQKPEANNNDARKEMRIQGLLNIPDGNLATDNLLEIKAAIKQDKDNAVTYELQLPFSTFYKENITAADTAKAISIGITINGLSFPAAPDGMDGPPGGGGGGPGPPGGDGNGPPPAFARMMQLSQAQETWIKVLLSYR